MQVGIAGRDRPAQDEIRPAWRYANHRRLHFGFHRGDDRDQAGAPQPAPSPADQLVADYPQEPLDAQFAESAPPAFRPPYQGQADVAPVFAQVHPQPPTTLIFKDGRPSAQVHNYALTATTLYALDGESRQEIPLSLLDVPATVAANRAAGVDFALPVSR